MADWLTLFIVIVREHKLYKVQHVIVRYEQRMDTEVKDVLKTRMSRFGYSVKYRGRRCVELQHIQVQREV